MGVDFILQQGGAGRRATPADVALVNNDNIMTVASQFICDQRAGYARAHDYHITLQVGIKLWERKHQAILDCPEGVSAFQVHLLLLRN